MADTTTRALQLLSALQAQRSWSGAELADRLGTSLRTLRRDVDRLRELGYPVRARPGASGGYQLAAGAVLPPLVLDDEEAVAIAVGLRTATRSAVAGVAESSAGALIKIVQVMPPRLRRRVDALTATTTSADEAPRAGGDDVDPRVLTDVAGACRDRERLAFAYTDAAGAGTERSVEPHRLVSLGRRWYLVGYDLGRQDWRTFRLDRTTRPTGTGVRFRPREVPGGDPAALVREGVREGRATVAASALLGAPAADVRRALGRWAEVEAVDDGRCRVRMAAVTLDWAALALGSVGAEASEVEPAALRAHLGEWAQRFARAARG